MKIKYFALSLLACVGMMSCSNNDDLAGDDGQKGDGVKSTSYLAVNIMNTGIVGTRANGYEAGSDAENAIKDIRFYLFDNMGAAYEVESGKSYVAPAYSKDDDAATSDNVEEIGEAVLLINGTQPVAPASIVAVANGNNLADKYSLSELRDVLASDYKNSEGNFTMSNSVYADGSNEICAVSVDGHVASSSEAALANPVDIYIERMAAKVKVSFTGENWSEIDGKQAYLLSGTAGDDDAVYAQVQGWTLVNVPDKSFLVKDIDASWNDTSLGFSSSSPWTSADYHRSFWAQMPSSGVTFSTSFTPSATTTADKYTLENTSSSSKTKLLVYVKLVNKDGDAISRYVYLGDATSYSSESDVLTVMLSVFNSAQGETYYIKTGTTAEATSYASLAPANLKFVSGASLNDAENSYRAYAQLNTPFASAAEGEGEKLYKKNSTGEFEEVTLSEINTALKSYTAQIWKDGACYYTATIKHLGSESSTAEYGIVRNHVYDMTVTEIGGYGTPIYDPTEEIVKPVTPSDDHSYLAARVNILSWKVVSNNVTLQ